MSADHGMPRNTDRPCGTAVRRQAAPSRRPLFVGVGVRGHIDVDGPALRLRAPGRADSRFPLERVSRIVVGARVSWSADALRACLETGVPIVIMTTEGSPLGSVHPAIRRPSRLAEAFEELLDWPNWRDIYLCWLRAARMRILAEWRRAQQADRARGQPFAYPELVRRHVYGAQTDAQACLPAAPIWRAALFALAAETIHRWGIAPVMWGSAGELLDLRRDMAELLELRLRLEVREQAEAALKGEATMLFAFHAFADKLESEAMRLMCSLARRVREVLSECR